MNKIQNQPAVIPFPEIDQRLKTIGKDRRWLALASGRSWNSIRNALAPNAAASQRSRHLQQALSQAIESEEQRQAAGVLDSPPVNQIVLRADSARFAAWNGAALAKGQTVAAWAASALDAAAGHSGQ